MRGFGLDELPRRALEDLRNKEAMELPRRFRLNRSICRRRWRGIRRG